MWDATPSLQSTPYTGTWPLIRLYTKLHCSLTIQQPQYLSEPIRLYETLRQLRPRGANILQYSPAVFNFSRSAFCHASLTIWDNLPETVISDITVSTVTFKSRLKTALYSRAFLHWHVTLSALEILHVVKDLTCIINPV